MHRIPDLGPEGIDHRSAPRYLFGLILRQKASTAWGVVTSGVWNTSQAFIPVAMGRAIDLGITDRNSGELVLWSVVVMLLGAVRALSGVAFYRQTIITRTVSAGLSVQMITRHVSKLGGTLARKQDAGEVTATVTSDVTTIGAGLLHVGRVLGSVVAVVVVTIIMLTISLPLGLLVLVIVPALLVLSSLLLRPLHRDQDTYRTQQGRLAARAVDIAAGLRVLRGVGGERQFSAAFHSDSAELRIADTQVARAEANLDAARVLMPGVIAAAVTYTAARFVLDMQVSIGQLVAFYGFAVFLTLPLNDIMEGANQVTRALVSAGRVTALLNTETPERGTPSEGTGRGAARLHDPDSGLDVAPGTLVAVACADADDVETLSQRITGFDEPGGTTLGGIALSALPPADVRARLLLARNNDRFFSGRVRDEITGASTADADQLAAALELACAGDIVDALAEGLDTPMRARGRTFSGGEQQRLRLARAVLARAEVAVLVEPTNSVDAYTEHTIAANLARAHSASDAATDAPVGGRSTVVFTVSPQLLGHAQRVAYVVDGHVVATGTHADLLADNPGYRALTTRDDVAVGDTR